MLPLQEFYLDIYLLLQSYTELENWNKSDQDSKELIKTCNDLTLPWKINHKQIRNAIPQALLWFWEHNTQFNWSNSVQMRETVLLYFQSTRKNFHCHRNVIRNAIHLKFE